MSTPASRVRHTDEPERRRAHRPGPTGRSGRVSAYALGVLVAACGVCGWLLVHGAHRPPLATVALLAFPLTLCMNRFVFFPNEVGVTAEAATLFVAIVGFRSDSPLLAPMLLALLVGVLDGRHWERRAFLRMSYNSGSQALTVLAAAWVFGETTAGLGSSAPALLLATVPAALVYVGVETCCGVVLVVMLGEPARVALRHQLPVNALALPLASFGAVVALAVAPTSWWLASLALVPTAFVPELVLVGMRRASRRRVAGALVLATGALIVLVIDVLVRGPGLVGLVGLVALALLLGVDVRPPLRRGLAQAAVLVSATAAGLASLFSLVVVCVAACVVALVAVAVRSRPGEAAWSLPLALAGASVAAVNNSITVPVGLTTVIGVAAVIAAAATWGALPWPSRVLAPWGARRRSRAPVLLLVGVGVLALVSSGWCLVTGSPLAAHVAVAATAVALACAAAGVRQWRFAPAARRRDATMLAAAGAIVALLLLAGTPTSSGVVAVTCVATLTVVIGVGVACVRSIRRARRSRDGRSPDRSRVL